MSNEERYYKELPLFNSVSNPAHKAWNRLNIINNLNSADRKRDALNYFEKLSKLDQVSIALLLTAIKKKGIDTVRAEINRGVVDETSSNS